MVSENLPPCTLGRCNMPKGKLFYIEIYFNGKWYRYGPTKTSWMEGVRLLREKEKEIKNPGRICVEGE